MTTTIRIGLDAPLMTPAVWTVYATPVVTGLWPEVVISFEGVTVINGVLEVLFGLILLLDRYTPLVAGVVALSLVGVVINLTVGALTTGTTAARRHIIPWPYSH